MNLITKPAAALIWSSLILLAAPARGAVVAANYTTVTTVPVTVASYTASGNTVDFSLNFAPPPGTNLTVVKNTGGAFIQGAFDNLAQAQLVNLTYGGVTYPFVANYFGGTGNDLVLQWANTRLLAWGANSYGQLGNGGAASGTPAAVDASGALAGKILLAVTGGGSHSFALCADGTVAGWGTYNQVGLGRSNNETRPVAVGSGELANRTVVAVDAGAGHTLALCADGALVAWGSNSYGQLGNANAYNTPVLADQSGVLAGKTITQIAAGGSHSLVLCSDGALAAWGYGGRLGNNLSTASSAPVLVTRTGVLAGKLVVAIAAGGAHSLALCGDGTLAAWGGNASGQLGNNSTNNALVPVLVNRSGALAGKTITAIAAGGSHSLALCSDGVVVAWGENGDGQLGGGTGTTDQLLPALVNRSGVLSGKTVVAVDAGSAFSVARCSDGSMAAWGAGSNGQLGNGGTTSSNAAVTVNASGLGAGERFAGAWCGDVHGLALVASPPPPAVETLAASGVGDVGATLSGTASGNGSNAAVSFEYGPTTLYGAGITGTPASVTGTAIMPVTAVLTGLAPNTIYHYRMVASGPGGPARGEDVTFATSDVAALKRLTLAGATLWPAFRSELTAYSAAVPAGTTSITVTATSRSDTATVTLNGVTVPSGAASEAINLVSGNNAIEVAVAEGGQTRTYTVTVTRLPEIYAFDTPAGAPVTVGGMVATGQRVEFALNHAPAVGANLTVVSNTGVDFIQGSFDNLAQGQVVQLGFGGVVYPFVANYFGGTGNDLVLQWGSNRLLAWGSNGSGELGTTSASNSTVPVAVDSSGVLAGKTMLSASLGSGHSLVWCADGALAAWGGRQSYVGDGSGSWPAVTLPVLVDRTGVFAGKTIAAIAASGNIRVAACADGTLAKWGSDGSANSYTRPLLVAADELVGRKVVAVAAGTDHALALCADGLLVAWGINTSGQLGNNSTTNTTEPVRVIRDGVLFGKTIIAIAAGTAHSYALCADGSVAAWGANDKGQLGDGTTVMRKFPVLVDRSGVLAGRTVVAISAGGNSGLVRCADGKLAAWGDNASGQLGDGTTANRTTPVLVNQSGVLAGKTVTAAFAGYSHSLVQCTDGTVAVWGSNASGQFGNATVISSNVPVVGGLASLREGERLGACYGGGNHTLAVVAMPPPPLALTLAATGIKDRGATLNGSVNGQGTASTMRFEYGLTTAYGSTVAVAGTATGTAATPTSVTLGDLLAGNTYHYRVVAENSGGVARGADLTFTTSTFASLAGLSLSEGALSPAFAGALTNYSATVPFATGSLTVTPVTGYPDAMATVNGAAVASGAASAPVSLTLGNNPLPVRVVSADGLNTTDYTINVVRLPETFTFGSATTVPLTVGTMAAAGEVPPIVLGLAPVPGTQLTLVNNTGTQPIAGTFANLGQGQLLVLSNGGVSYQFVANYFGGTGNDLVLYWANTRLVKWGANTLVPTPIEMTGALAGKTVVLGGSGSHQMALSADGTLAGWGSNTYGQLGINSTTDQTSPVAVDRSGVLAGRNVIDLVVGNSHNLALCSDGALVAWGYNNYGQLGINSTTNSLVPVAVNTAGVLAGRRITALAAGDSHSLAL
jgi:alpha-tubulin suppressor-like RCC1 family protein